MTQHRIPMVQTGTARSTSAHSPRIVGIIPARGGSKGVPRKNVRLVAGKPLLYYMLSAALRSRSLSHLVVSSDDSKILSLAAQYGNSTVPLRRPKRLAQDKTLDVPVLQHAVCAIERSTGVRCDYVVQLHATTPFLTTADIDNALKLLLDCPEAESVVSVFATTDYHPVKLKRIVDGRLLQYVPEYEEKTTGRRQDLDPVYKRNGGLYASKRHVIMEQNRVFGDCCLPYIMPYERSFEVDRPVDLLIASYLMRHLHKRGKF